jgi:hypothetical protein
MTTATPSPQFWRVYNYISGQWYAQEYGKVEAANRWYQPAMIFMESLTQEENRCTADDLYYSYGRD